MTETNAIRHVRYSRGARRTLKRIDAGTARRIRDKIDRLASDPESLANNVIALRGGHGLMRLRVGSWRIIYTDDLMVLLVVKIAPRGSACD